MHLADDDGTPLRRTIDGDLVPDLEPVRPSRADLIAACHEAIDNARKESH